MRNLHRSRWSLYIFLSLAVLAPSSRMSSLCEPMAGRPLIAPPVRLASRDINRNWSRNVFVEDIPTPSCGEMHIFTILCGAVSRNICSCRSRSLPEPRVLCHCDLLDIRQRLHGCNTPQKQRHKVVACGDLLKSFVKVSRNALGRMGDYFTDVLEHKLRLSRERSPSKRV